jgi:hypothetical protein
MCVYGVVRIVALRLQLGHYCRRGRVSRTASGPIVEMFVSSCSKSVRGGHSRMSRCEDGVLYVPVAIVASDGVRRGSDVQRSARAKGLQVDQAAIYGWCSFLRKEWLSAI